MRSFDLDVVNSHEKTARAPTALLLSHRDSYRDAAGERAGPLHLHIKVPVLSRESHPVV